MYRVTLHRLGAGAMSAAPDFGPRECGVLSSKDLTALLNRFCDLDPTENSEADPEIQIETGIGKYRVQTNEQKLLLHNARDPAAPAQVVTPEELIAELNGTAQAARAPAPFGEPVGAVGPIYVPPQAPRRRSTRISVLLSALGLLVAAIVISRWLGDDLPLVGDEPVQPLASGELAAARGGVTGVYLTGIEPNPHGIALSDDGAVKLFRVNKIDAPSVVRDTYHPGHRGKAFVLAIENLDTVVEVVDANTLVYCGETFHRIP